MSDAPAQPPANPQPAPQPQPAVAPAPAPAPTPVPQAQPQPQPSSDLRVPKSDMDKWRERAQAAEQERDTLQQQVTELQPWKVRFAKLHTQTTHEGAIRQLVSDGKLKPTAASPSVQRRFRREYGDFCDDLPEGQEPPKFGEFVETLKDDELFSSQFVTEEPAPADGAQAPEPAPAPTPAPATRQPPGNLNRGTAAQPQPGTGPKWTQERIRAARTRSGGMSSAELKEAEEELRRDGLIR